VKGAVFPPQGSTPPSTLGGRSPLPFVQVPPVHSPVPNGVFTVGRQVGEGHEAEWVSRCLASFDQVWDTLNPENRGRLVRAVIERVEVDEPKGDVRTFIADMGCAPEVTTLVAETSA